MDLSEQFALMYTEVQAPLPHRTMEYDNLTVLGLYLCVMPIPRQRAAVGAGHMAPPAPTLRPYGPLPNMSDSSGTPGADRVRSFPGFPLSGNTSKVCA